jgi:anti-sigma regulatory factor (Ser/Thr protein kinase)
MVRALEEARAGHLEEAVKLAESVPDVTFVRRRLEHYKSQPDHREAAYQLETALAAAGMMRRGPTVHAERSAFDAPLPPAGAIAAPAGQIDFDSAAKFLLWASGNWDEIGELSLDSLRYTDVWALVAMGALCLEERPRRPPVRLGGTSPAARFAHAVGLDALAGGTRPGVLEQTRTVRLTRVRTREEIEPVADRIATLVSTGPESHDARLAVRYVLVELLRNVVQHSQDPSGAVVAAQRMDQQQRRSRPMIQLAVADAGIGIPRSLQREHPHLIDYRQALERALLPHISGTFREGLTGSLENAGMGLYVISEMARKTHGRLLIATTGAALVLQGGTDGQPPSPRFLEPLGIGFPGTLAAFEIPTDAVQDYRTLITGILQTAKERTPKRAASNWLIFEPAPGAALRLPVVGLRENTVEAARTAGEAISPAILKRTTVELSFAGLDLCTQSWLHALLYEPVRLAWAMRVPIHVVDADPAVREGLRFLEAYALGG